MGRYQEKNYISLSGVKIMTDEHIMYIECGKMIAEGFEKAQGEYDAELAERVKKRIDELLNAIPPLPKSRKDRS